jgi:hypothetical protein
MENQNDNGKAGIDLAADDSCEHSISRLDQAGHIKFVGKRQVQIHC